MATFLFLVSVTATTLLLLAIAVEEVLNVARRLSSRWSAGRNVAAIEIPEFHERPVLVSEEASHVAKAQPSRAIPRNKPVVDEGDWDRAA